MCQETNDLEHSIDTEVPTSDHEKKEGILEGRKNCGRQCTAHADSPRAPPVHTRIPPPPRKC